MRDDHPRALAELLNNTTTGLGALQKRAALLGQIQTLIRSFLPKAAQSHIRLGDISPSKIELLADSAAWAQRVQFQRSQILSGLRANGYSGLKTLNVTVRPHTPTIDRQAPQQHYRVDRRLSENSCDDLEMLAESVGGPLAEALKHLVATARKNRKTS